jgi:hypothetical protein
VFGPLADYDPASDEEPDAEFGTHLLRCCGGDRPRKKKARLTCGGRVVVVVVMVVVPGRAGKGS